MENEEKTMMFLDEKNKRLTDWMWKNHKSHVKSFEKSQLSKIRPITEHDIACLAQQVQNFELYKNMCEAQGSLGNLGKLPQIALDVVVASMGSSILPVIASVQPIEEQKGIVYFRQIRSENTRGSQTAGDVVVDPRTGTVTPSAYASNLIESETGVASTVAATLDYAFTLAALPVLPETLSLSFSGDATVVAVDQGPLGADKNIGTLFGKNLSGTIDYTTGDVNIEFSNDPGNAESVSATYQQDLERGEDLQQISSYLDSKSIQSRVYALKATEGMLQSFTMQKRFGSAAQEQLATDLVMEVNREVGGDAIRKIKAAAQGTTTFSRTPTAGVSFAEHKLEYKDELYNADNQIVTNSGRGQINVLIAGRKHCAFLRGLPGFELLSDGNTLGAHVFGRLDGITVVRVTETALLGEDEGIGLYRGQNPYEAACVYSPFMPMAVTDMLPEGKNPLSSMRAAATMAGVDACVPQYATKFNLVP